MHWLASAAALRRARCHSCPRYHPFVTEDMIPAYIALIRRELKIAACEDALECLKARLAPTDPKDKLPARAPGIVRLRAAARALEKGRCPDSPLEEFAADLHLLRLFAHDDDPMPREAMQKLLQDVMGAAPLKESPRRADFSKDADAKIVPFSEKGRAK